MLSTGHGQLGALVSGLNLLHHETMDADAVNPYRRGVRRHVLCERCRKKWPRDHFPMNADSSIKQFLCAQSCFTCIREKQEKIAARGKPKVRTSSKPCENCHRYWESTESASALERKRFCGRDCSNDFRVVKMLKCRSCNHTLPREDFRREGQTHWRGKIPKFCNECIAAAKQRGSSRCFSQKSAGHFWRSTWVGAAATKNTQGLTRSFAAQLQRRKCYLCGENCGMARLIDRNKPWSFANAVTLCTTCSRCVAVLGLAEVLAFAHRVAHHRPLAGR